MNAKISRTRPFRACKAVASARGVERCEVLAARDEEVSSFGRADFDGHALVGWPGGLAALGVLAAFQVGGSGRRTRRAARAVESTHLGRLCDRPPQDSRSVGLESTGKAWDSRRAEFLLVVEAKSVLSEMACRQGHSGLVEYVLASGLDCRTRFNFLRGSK